MNNSIDAQELLSPNSHRPPKHPSLSMHLPAISSPGSQPSRPRFSIVKSPRLKTIESSIGYINASLTPNASSSYRALFKSFGSCDSDEQNTTDIEKIISQQSYVYVPKKANTLNKSFEAQVKSPCSSDTNKKKKERTFSQVVSHLESQPLKLPQIYLESQEKPKFKRMIIPDIPKAAFGVHKPYHELNIQEDFKLIQVEEKTRDVRFRSRTDSLADEKIIREKVLREILLEKHCDN